MNARTVKKSNRLFAEYFPTTLPSMGWYFSTEVVGDARVLPEDQYCCLFSQIYNVAQGEAICFSAQSAGCSGAACYFGFSRPSPDAGGFLATKEKFKQEIGFAHQFYAQINAAQPSARYLILSGLEFLNDDCFVEVVNMWVEPVVLSGLVTMANFDSPANDNVTTPFASGCQSMWTLPYKERNVTHPKATIGALDPAMRKYIPANTLMFSVPASRYCQMADNLPDSFAALQDWRRLISKAK
ncbi:MAG: hypothetical protein D6B25_01085 [Desulfobulbaceae bacterium]|nr:MAG: hypothetical protein D6B25_01085 [Desulfobulbaceae bacterium]